MDIIDPRVDPMLVPKGSKAVVVAEHQDEYRDLPSVRTPCAQVITRWMLTDEERAAIIRGADLFLTILAAGPVQPVLLTVGPIDWVQQARDMGFNPESMREDGEARD